MVELNVPLVQNRYALHVFKILSKILKNTKFFPMYCIIRLFVCINCSLKRSDVPAEYSLTLPNSECPCVEVCLPWLLNYVNDIKDHKKIKCFQRRK